MCLFSFICLGFIYANGVTALFTGISMALAGVTGIIGTFCFTKLRKRIGLERTGLFAYSFDISCLCLCVASVFAPGSPFDPHYHPTKAMCPEENVDMTTVSPLLMNQSVINESLIHSIGKRDLFNSKNDRKLSSAMYNFVAMNIDSPHVEDPVTSSFNFIKFNEQESVSFGANHVPTKSHLAPNQVHFISKRAVESDKHNYTGSYMNKTLENCHVKWKHDGLNLSVILLLIGIVVSRIGKYLWLYLGNRYFGEWDQKLFTLNENLGQTHLNAIINC